MNNFKIGDLVRSKSSPDEEWVGLIVRKETVERYWSYWNAETGMDDMGYFYMDAIIVKWANDGSEDEYIDADLKLLEKLSERR